MKRSISIAFGLIFAILLAGCKPAPMEFSIMYSQDYAFKGYKKNITVSPIGDFEYKLLDYETGVVRTSVSGKLSESELQELSEVSNTFFSLPENLTVQNCFDASIEFLEIESDGKAHRAGGYCVENDFFRNTVQKLNDYQQQFREVELSYIWIDDPVLGGRGEIRVQVIDGLATITHVPGRGIEQTIEKQISKKDLNAFANFVENLGYFDPAFPAKKELPEGMIMPPPTHKTQNRFFIRVDDKERELEYMLPSPEIEESDEAKVRRLIQEIDRLTGFGELISG